MHGGHGGEDRKRRRHMWPGLPAPGTPATPPVQARPVALSDPNSFSSSPDCFVKDGRNIRVGDCALFQSGNAPPFIGIIRCFVTSKEDHLKLCVNWLYRPSDVKLAKGILLEAAPNEVFYSFHKDVISATSLLHPCKVAFLHEGVDLPSGISSFVCRRVYDTESKCLWWLTDKDYINERQEEVDRLLDKTRLEMHASPNSLNGSASTHHLKSGSDAQNSGTLFPSQVKGKKRDRVDQVNEPIKRERYSKIEDDDFVNSRLDGMVKAEIAKITDKGGLTSTEGVDKLVYLMQHDKAERKIDLVGRVLLADVIAATDRNDCLSRFVQLKGVPVLNDWLQEVHKGKIGDGNIPKESDNAVDELLLALLRALDKLPVSLNALQTCNIGKSVNHLRTHKNLEIQKKARSLVDTWKKRVDAEIKNNEAKSFGSSQAVPWPGKSGFSEASHALNRRAGSTDMTLKISIAQPSTCRALPSKPGHADTIVKSAPVTAGSLKLPSPLPACVVISPKDSKEEKSSSSSQSLSCSSDHAKTMSSSWKEDARSSSAGSMSASKTSGGSSRHRRLNNGIKETNLSKCGSPIRPADLPVSDQINSHRLIVRLPNPGRSPVQSAGGGSFEDPSVISSRVSSPNAPDKFESRDRKTKARSDPSHTATDVNTESWQGNTEEECMSAQEKDKATEGGSLAQPELRISRSSMNALIESCTPLSVDDDIGMNLLANAATGDMSKSDILSPKGSPETSSAIDEFCAGDNEAKSRLSCGDCSAQSHGQSDENGDVNSVVRDESQGMVTDLSCDKKVITPLQENLRESHKAAASCMKSEDKLEERADNSLCEPAHSKEEIEDEAFQPQDKRENHGQATNSPSSCKLEVRSSSMDENKPAGRSISEGEKIVESGSTSTQQQLTPVSEIHTENVDRRDAAAGVSSGADKALDSNGADSETRNTDSFPANYLGQIDSERKEPSNCDGVEEVVETKEDRENHPPGPTNFGSSPTSLAQEAERCTKSTGSKLSGSGADRNKEPASSAEAGSVTKLDFDLNEGILGDDANQSEPSTSAVLLCSSAIHLPCVSTFSSSPMSNGSPAPITVAAPAKGPFVPPRSLSKKPEPGWKGSAATSAFRPAEPRKVPSSRPVLDIDLNVPDERVVEDMASQSSPTGSESIRSSGGLGLDLNRLDEGAENGQFSRELPSGSANMLRDFDLNNGPGLDEVVGVESLPRSHYAKSSTSVPFLPPVAGLRMNNSEFGSVSSWVPTSNSYPAVSIPSFLPDRGEYSYPIGGHVGAQRILGPTFGGDIYRGPVLSSFPYAGFPFGSSFPVASTSFTVDSSSGGGSGFPTIPAHYPRPYMLSHPEDATTSGSDSSRKWARQGLDLNAGPGSAIVEVKEERFSSAPRQLSIVSSQAFMEEQARLYQATGGNKGVWEADKFLGYKQHSWQ